MSTFKCSDETLTVLSKVQQGKIMGLQQSLENPEKIDAPRATNVVRWYVGLDVNGHEKFDYIQNDCGVTIEVLQPFFDKIGKSFQECKDEILRQRQPRSRGGQSQYRGGQSQYRGRQSHYSGGQSRYSGGQSQGRGGYRPRQRRQYKSRDVGEQLYQMSIPMNIVEFEEHVGLITKPIKLPRGDDGENIKFGLPKIKEEYRSSPDVLEYGFILPMRMFRMIFKVRGPIEVGKKLVEITWYKSGEEKIYCRATKFDEYVEPEVISDVEDCDDLDSDEEVEASPPPAPVANKKKSFLDVLKSKPPSESPTIVSLMSKFNAAIDEDSTLSSEQLDSIRELQQKLTSLISKASPSA